MKVVLIENARCVLTGRRLVKGDALEEVVDDGVTFTGTHKGHIYSISIDKAGIVMPPLEEQFAEAPPKKTSKPKKLELVKEEGDEA